MYVLHLGLSIACRGSLDSLCNRVHFRPHDRHFGGVASCCNHEGKEGCAEDEGYLECRVDRWVGERDLIDTSCTSTSPPTHHTYPNDRGPIGQPTRLMEELQRPNRQIRRPVPQCLYGHGRRAFSSHCRRRRGGGGGECVGCHFPHKVAEGGGGGGWVSGWKAAGVDEGGEVGVLRGGGRRRRRALGPEGEGAGGREEEEVVVGGGLVSVAAVVGGREEAKGADGGRGEGGFPPGRPCGGQQEDPACHSLVLLWVVWCVGVGGGGGMGLEMQCS